MGNVWHPTWGDAKGTDLGGPADNFSAAAFGKLSTVRRKNLQLPTEGELLAAQFNSLTPEVALKPHCISIAPDIFGGCYGGLATTNGLRVHGRALV